MEYKVASLKTQNFTALGPGLLTAVGMAAEGKPGSQVIVCTDGLSNYGLGNLESNREDENAKAKEFYNKVAEYA